MFSLFKATPAPKAAPQTQTCRHIAWTDLGEGVRFCPRCKTVQRLERRRIPEAGKDPWGYVTLSREKAIEVVKDLEERKRS